jgi:outer membrane protein TolC
LKYASGEYDIAVKVYNDTLTNALREVSDALTSRASLKDEMLYSQGQSRRQKRRIRSPNKGMKERLLIIWTSCPRKMSWSLPAEN